MPLVERLRLDHVLQTVSVLESVVLRSFGPEGGQVLFTRDTGQAMLSRSGMKILSALRLEHPLARMIVECVLKHSSITGDGSKTFILLLASLLRMIHSTACKEPLVSHAYNSREAAVAATARRLANKLLTFALEGLEDIITVGVVPYGFCLSREDFTGNTSSLTHTPCVQKLLSSFFHTRLGLTHSDFFSQLTNELLSKWKLKNDPLSSSLHFIRDNLSALHTPVTGFPVSCSRLIEGQVIHRDFATSFPQHDQRPVRAVVLSSCLQPELLRPGEVLELGYGDQRMDENARKGRTIVHFSAWAERSLECAIAKLKSLGVSLILSAVKQSTAALASAAQADICVVECVGEDELSLFVHLSGATPVTDCWMIQQNHVATLEFCKPILLGAHRYVQVAFHDSDTRPMVRPHSLVICGSGEGQTDQYVSALHDAISMLLSTWEPMGETEASALKKTLQPNEGKHYSPSFHYCSLEPGLVVPAGGTFELLLHHALLKHGHRCLVSDDTDMDTVSKLLAKAVLCVPRQIHSHSPRYSLQTQTRLLSSIQKHSQPSSSVDKLEHSVIPAQCGYNSLCPLGGDKQSVDCCGATDLPPKSLMLDSGLESVSCKYWLIQAVLQCLSKLLQVDSMLHIRSTSQLKRLTDVSYEEEE